MPVEFVTLCSYSDWYLYWIVVEILINVPVTQLVSWRRNKFRSISVLLDSGCVWSVVVEQLFCLRQYPRPIQNQHWNIHESVCSLWPLSSAIRLQDTYLAVLWGVFLTASPMISRLLTTARCRTGSCRKRSRLISERFSVRNRVSSRMCRR